MMQMEMVTLVLSYLDAKALLLKSALVCKLWLKIAQTIKSIPLYMNTMHQMYKQFHDLERKNETLVKQKNFNFAKVNKDVAAVAPFRTLQVFTRQSSTMPVPRKCDIRELLQVHAKLDENKTFCKFVPVLLSPFSNLDQYQNAEYPVRHLVSSLFMCAMYNLQLEQIVIVECTSKQIICTHSMKGVEKLHMWFDAKDQQVVHAEYGAHAQKLAVFQLLAITATSICHFQIVDVKLASEKTSKCSIKIVSQHDVTGTNMKDAWFVRTTGALFAYDATKASIVQYNKSDNNTVITKVAAALNPCYIHVLELKGGSYGITLMEKKSPKVHHYLCTDQRCQLISTAKLEMTTIMGKTPFTIYVDQIYFSASGRFIVFNADVQSDFDCFGIVDATNMGNPVEQRAEYGLLMIRQFGVTDSFIFCNCDDRYVNRSHTTKSQKYDSAIASVKDYEEYYKGTEAIPCFRRVNDSRIDLTATVSELGYMIASMMVEYDREAQGQFALLEIK